RRLLAAEIDLSAEQVVEQWTAATVGHGGESGADRTLEQHPAKVTGGAEAGIRERHLLALRLGVGDELGRRVGLEIEASNDGHWRVGDESDRRERSLGVVGQLAIERRGRGEPKVIDQQR